MLILVCLLLGVLYISLEYISSFNHVHIVDRIIGLRDRIKTTTTTQWTKVQRLWRSKLTKEEFNQIKMAGVVPVKRSAHLVSRSGVAKLQDILRQTRVSIKGNVLDLCSGRGGWDQVCAAMPGVSSITSITFGRSPATPGHEEPTTKSYLGKEKVKVIYGDIRKMPPISHDVLLFDGGEEKSNPDEEARKFNDLLNAGVLRQVTGDEVGFIIRVLTPFDDVTLSLLTAIQVKTGKGDFVRSIHSRLTSNELYFVSTTLEGNLVGRARKLILECYDRGITNPVPSLGIYPSVIKGREKVYEKRVRLLQPLNMTLSVKELGPPMQSQGRQFNHWQSLGVYPYGIKGSSGTRPNRIASEILGGLTTNMDDYHHWKATDTTVKGFEEVFRKKIDTGPRENTDYDDCLYWIYDQLPGIFKKKGFKYKELTWEEVEEQANKQGARGFIDLEYDSVGDFLKRSDWKELVQNCLDALIEGTPIGGIFNTMGKREKKKSVGRAKGSRMVAYLPIAMRLAELKIFGCLLELTKPEINHYAVGGIGLHDLGMRIKEVWKGCASSSDIAGFDTRVGIHIQSLESHMIRKLGAGIVAENFYRLYAYPMILIPIEAGNDRRSELLSGRGQRMSGSNPTYSMNTITRTVLALVQMMVADGVDIKSESSVRKAVNQLMSRDSPYGGGISGDDEFVTSDWDRIHNYSRCGYVLHDLGFERKNLHRGVFSPVALRIEEVDFCSHHYVPVTYYDEWTGRVVSRYQPARDVSEILAKASIWLGSGTELMDEEAWISAQGNNLLVNYHHLRTPRAVGLAFKAVVDPSITLGDKGAVFMRRAWMRDGEILEVINNLLFGDSTRYPIDGFRVYQFRHLGYVNFADEFRFDPGLNEASRIRWRKNLVSRVRHVAYMFNFNNDISILELNWRRVCRVKM